MTDLHRLALARACSGKVVPPCALETLRRERARRVRQASQTIIAKAGAEEGNTA